jgi:hypothetical protein
MMSMEQISEDQVTTAEVATRDIELERVEAWRMEELERAGYGAEAATELAQRHDIDLHAAVALIARGCPPETAVRILL